MTDLDSSPHSDSWSDVLEVPISLGTPEELKAQLPLEWVIGECWGLWGVGSRRVICPFPDHKDDTPSFNLWAPGLNGYYTKFGCYGCGERGDAIDVIQKHYQVGYYAALDIGFNELLPEFLKSNYRVGVDTRSWISPEHVENEYAHLMQGGSDQDVYYALLEAKRMLELNGYPHREWRWSGHLNIRALSMPHYDEGGNLTGVKFRDPVNLSSKWGIRGSKYPTLYGAWRDTGAEDVVLCEGESDTVWTAYYLQGRKCDVFGLPTGANQPAVAQALELLGDRRVWMVFDGDAAGEKAAEIWRKALGDKAKRIAIAAGEDVMSCGIPVTEILGLKETNGH